MAWYFMFVFFFQAEDGIRDLIVTGVQTCALPISHDRCGSGARNPGCLAVDPVRGGTSPAAGGQNPRYRSALSAYRVTSRIFVQLEIGRASCRGRGEISVGAGSLKKKKTEEKRI